jgi:NADH:ubiquinone oxidoreductase subunit K
MLVNQFLLLSAMLFCIGVYGVLVRRNGVLVLMSIELILNSVNLNLIAFGGHARCGRVGVCLVRHRRGRRRGGRGTWPSSC